MKRIQYISRWNTPLCSEEIADIGRLAASKNAQMGVSGFLISIGDIFFQLLEGDDQSIDDLYFNNITKDCRHKDVTCLRSETDIEGRVFPDWSMKLLNLEEHEQVIPDVIRIVFDTLISSQDILLKYTQPSVVELLRLGVNPTLARPRKVEKVILMSDLIGFSLLTEIFPAEVIVGLVNRFIEIASDIISSHGGEINKLMGDSVMAIFPGDQAKQALKSATSMLLEFEKLRRSTDRDLPYDLMYCGVGLSSGQVVEGNVGSASKKDFTVIGSAVNYAARIEAMTRQQNRLIIVSESIRRQALGSWNFEALGIREVKGKTEAEQVFSLTDIEPVPIKGIYERIKSYYHRSQSIVGF